MENLFYVILYLIVGSLFFHIFIKIPSIYILMEMEVLLVNILMRPFKFTNKL